MSDTRPYKGKRILSDIHDYTVIDLETTGKNINTCEIIELAAVKVENDEIVGRYSQLVQPSEPVSAETTCITGITNEMLVDSPRIEEVIEEFLDFIGDDIILGHNICSFDSNIIYDVCEGLGLPHFSNTMLDTLIYVRHCNIDTPNDKLTTLTKYFNIEHSEAHRALADCIANHECYQRLKSFFDESTIKESSSVRSHYHRSSEETMQLHELSAIVKGVLSDNILTDDEIRLLSKWTTQNEHLKGNYPFDVISKAVNDVLEDGVITEDEREYLIEILSDYDDPVEKKSESITDVTFEGSKIVLTGEFTSGTREEVTKKLEGMGAEVQNNVTRKTDFVIVGGYGSSDWAHGNYGTKVKKALELQANGNNIRIIKEDDFFRSFEEQKGQTLIGLDELFNRVNSEIVSEQRIPDNVLKLEKNTEGQNKSESVWITEPVTGKRSKLLFNCYMRGRKNDRYATFVIHNSIAKYITPPDNVEVKTLSSDELHTYINTKEIDRDLETYIKNIMSYSVKSFEPSDKFGCCSKYKECSDAKRCLHNNLFYSKACWYRKNLEAGKIFY